VLQAVGFAPNTKGYGLESLGVATDLRTGGVVINDVMETAAPGVDAIGDVTAKLMLAHVADAEGSGSRIFVPRKRESPRVRRSHRIRQSHRGSRARGGAHPPDVV
jgi:pyruvate/2-oxoglutarate dehydrogenase complex dihydrolipoamide dehydrogenase (E3) component